MRKEIMDEELDQVSGGTVIISDQGVVGFSTVREKYSLNVGWKTARNLSEDLLEQNPGLSDAEFDQLVKQAFIDNGFITV